MIKIEIANIPDRQSKYAQKMITIITPRLEVFQAAIEQLHTGRISTTVDSRSYRAISHHLVNNVLELEEPESAFEPKEYPATISRLAAAGQVDIALQLPLLIKFNKAMLNLNRDLLKSLLICLPSGLELLNENVIRDYSLNEKMCEAYTFALNYGYDTIGKAIRQFFDDYPVVQVCPYCNAKEAEYVPDQHDGRADMPQLDHFYSQKDFPLLNCSVFNLVPTDTNCNGPIIKGSFKFEKDYHLNPYLEGFDNDLTFEAILTFPEMVVTEIKLNIHPEIDAIKRQRIIGNQYEVTEIGKLGNANVFKLKSNYNKTTVWDEAGINYRNIHKTATGLQSLKRFMAKMNRTFEQDYISWYNDAIHTPFEKSKFNTKRYAKLNRDIHDSYYQRDAQWRNAFVRELISTYS